jgi:hypothetical protein
LYYSEIGYDDETIEEVQTTKFLGLQIDNNLNQKCESILSSIKRVSPVSSFYDVKEFTLKILSFKYIQGIMMVL